MRTTIKQGSTARMVTTRDWNNINRLRSISSTAGGFVVSSHAYHYNGANQRDRADLRDGSYWSYQYDSLGQVDQGKKHWPDDTFVPGEQFEYTFDDIGNRTTARAGGNSGGTALRNASYAPNLLNQYDNRTVPGAVDILIPAAFSGRKKADSENVQTPGSGAAAPPYHRAVIRFSPALWRD